MEERQRKEKGSGSLEFLLGSKTIQTLFIQENHRTVYREKMRKVEPLFFVKIIKNYAFGSGNEQRKEHHSNHVSCAVQGLVWVLKRKRHRGAARRWIRERERSREKSKESRRGFKRTHQI